MKYIAVVLLLIGVNTFAAEVYKCKDSTGKTLYQDTPCQNGTQKVLNDLPSNSVKGPPIASKVASPSAIPKLPQSQDPAVPTDAAVPLAVNCSDSRYRDTEACRSGGLLKNRDNTPNLPGNGSKPGVLPRPQPLPARPGR